MPLWRHTPVRRRTVQTIRRWSFKRRIRPRCPPRFNTTSQRQVRQSTLPNDLSTILPTFLAVRPATSVSNIQFLSNASSNSLRPIIFHQKPNTASAQPQLLTVMPAGVRFQQLTPIVRSASSQSNTIVRLMSPVTSTAGLRPGIGQQQIIQFNTNKQQTQPLVLKGTTTQSSNRQQQQPIFLTTNAQSKTMLPQSQQQVLVFNQNSGSMGGGQQAKFTLQVTNLDPSPATDTAQHEATTTTTEPRIPQLDGSIDDQVKAQRDARNTDVRLPITLSFI